MKYTCNAEQRDSRSSKKSQAALEFLTTYAWAFLVILIMIGALAYFGILQPSKLLPDRCNFGSEISCEDFRINGGSSEINLRLKNGAGEPIIVTALNVSSDSATAVSCSTVTPAPSFTWGTDSIQDITFSSCGLTAAGIVSGEKAKVDVTVQYYAAKSSATYTKQVAGEVFVTVT